MDQILAESKATEDFKNDLRAYAEHRSAQRIATTRPVPRVKVVRVLSQLLSAESEMPVERVTIDAWSGCSDFRGLLTVESRGDVRTFEFVWDCHWRAVEEGYQDAFGLPDQIRAAREFGWQCFAHWKERTPVEA